MGKLHDVDFINNPGFLILCDRAGFVYTTILCFLLAFSAVPKQNDYLVNRDCQLKNVPLYSFSVTAVLFHMRTTTYGWYQCKF